MNTDKGSMDLFGTPAISERAHEIATKAIGGEYGNLEDGLDLGPEFGQYGLEVETDSTAPVGSFAGFLTTKRKLITGSTILVATLVVAGVAGGVGYYYWRKHKKNSQ